jgi:hypothetical protein
MKSFPKLFALGTKYVNSIFDEDVEITEKIDGSQFIFGDIAGELKMSSKGKELFKEDHEKMFSKAVSYVSSIYLPPDVTFYAEFLQKEKHNTLCYEKVPKNNLCLFGACDLQENFVDYEELKKFSKMLNIDVAPLIYTGKSSPEKIEELLDRESYLGGVKIEGVVVKNYKSWLFADIHFPLMGGKYVSEKFKEVHQKGWRDKTNKSKWELFKATYRTEARWEKAVQHLKEKGELEEDPRDIGKLCKEVSIDISKEEKDIIKDFLWNEFGKELLRKSVSGLPEWYKKRLLLK